MESSLRKDLRDRNFIIMLISGIVLASALTYYLLGLWVHQVEILQKVNTIEQKVESKNVTIVIPRNATDEIRGQISGIDKPIIIQ